MPMKSKVFIQTLQKSQDRQKISFAFEFNIENTKSLRGKSAPPQIQLSWIYPPIPLGLIVKSYYFFLFGIFRNGIIIDSLWTFKLVLC